MKLLHSIAFISVNTVPAALFSSWIYCNETQGLF